MTFSVGDIIEPRKNETPLPSGHYEVLHFGPDVAHLTRLLMEEEEAVARLNRITIVPVGLLAMFELSRLVSDERS